MRTGCANQRPYGGSPAIGVAAGTANCALHACKRCDEARSQAKISEDALLEVPAMHRRPKMLLTTALVVAASISVAQERYRSPDPDVMARLSYDNSGVVQQEDVRHVCIAVSRDGEYRIVRSLPAVIETTKGKCRIT
jgi:hypothetical protein